MYIAYNIETMYPAEDCAYLNKFERKHTSISFCPSVVVGSHLLHCTFDQVQFQSHVVHQDHSVIYHPSSMDNKTLLPKTLIVAKQYLVHQYNLFVM